MQYVTLPEQSAVTIGNVWTQIILKTEQNSSVFVWKRIRDRALGEYSKVWRVTLGLVLTNPFSKRSASTLIVFVSFSPVHTTTSYPFWKCCYTLSAHAQMNWTRAHFNISAREIGAKLKPHGSACPPFWILAVEWSGAWSCLFWWPHRFQIASFSPSTPENSVFKKHRFQIAPLWRAFSNGSGFGDRFRHCSADDSRIRCKTTPFSLKTD